ncbi:hypothetical protein BL253_25800 [Pseudofrankia asymbiotica]|uniref:Uncharacterized protein n=1 Tax=Pseudofrankia asymbiotica TaxID=1834516 RepID=A0A1V2I4X9_9ACTN|nr:hypothetical protein BL253_25800 [Pseudofrankia asymbiotica]
MAVTMAVQGCRDGAETAASPGAASPQAAVTYSGSYVTLAPTDATSATPATPSATTSGGARGTATSPAASGSPAGARPGPTGPSTAGPTPPPARPAGAAPTGPGGWTGTVTDEPAHSAPPPQAPPGRPKLTLSGPDPQTWNPTDSDPACAQADFTVTNSGDGNASGVSGTATLQWVRYEGIYPTWPDLATVEGVALPSPVAPGQSVTRHLRICGPTPPDGFYAVIHQVWIYVYFGETTTIRP